MTTTTILSVAAVTLLGACFSASASDAKHSRGISQDAAGTVSQAKDGLANTPVVVTLVGDPSNRVGKPVFVTVTLRNRSAETQLVKNMFLRVDTSEEGRFGASGVCPLTRQSELQLPPGDIYSQTCRFPSPAAEPIQPASGASSPAERLSPSGWEQASWYSSLFSADLRLLVEVDLEDTGVQRYYPSITIKAIEASIFAGGVAGAMLLALFVLAERVLRNPEVREDWGKSLLVTLLMGLRGGAMAIIALLLSKTTQGVGSPVVLTVTDFAGGMLIGLFSYPLATWISSTLKLDGAFVKPRSK